MSYFRPNIERMEGYTPGEQPQDAQYVKLNTNENPYPPSPKVLEALRDAAGESLRKYPDPVANDVRRVIARLARVKIDNVICGNGSDDLLSIAARAFLGPRRPLAIPYPTYSLYETLAAIQNAPLRSYPCGPNFELPVDALARAKAPLVIVSNPNAPTGVAAATADLKRIARRIPGVLLVDEAYADFADGTAMPLTATLPNVLVMRTLSKSYSLAGLRFGYLVGPRELIDGLMKVKDSYNCDRLAIVAARAALLDQAWMQRNIELIRAERRRLTQELRDLGFTVYDSQANFLLARPPKRNAAELYRKLKEHGILVRYFNKPRIDDCLRITVGTPTECTALLETLRKLL